MTDTTTHATRNPLPGPEAGPGLLLAGLDGANPLGFLAALGLWRLLHHMPPLLAPNLIWTHTRGAWRPRLTHGFEQAHNDEALINALADLLNTSHHDHPARRWGPFLDADAASARELILMHPDEWSACIGVEPLPNTDPTKRMSQLQTARKDFHIKAIDNLLNRSYTPDELRRTVFHPWVYNDPLEGLTLHLEPTEDRRHAYQWNQPSGDPDRKRQGNVIAANRLALEALPLFPCVHHKTTGRTCGFKGRRADDTAWTWPLWSVPVSLDTARTLLASAQLQRDRLDPGQLHPLGIAAAYRSRRILVGKTPNLTPAQRVA